MHIYIYIYIYVHTYTYIMYVYIYIYTHMYSTRGSPRLAVPGAPFGAMGGSTLAVSPAGISEVRKQGHLTTARKLLL